MTKKDKRIIVAFCAFLLVLAGCILLRYYNRVSNYYATFENSATAEDPAYLTGYYYTTSNSELTKAEDPDTITSKKTFIHQVYDQDEQHFVTVTVSITGSISSENRVISHISISEHLSGETGTVVLYVNQISVCHFQYRLTPDGSIDCL